MALSKGKLGTFPKGDPWSIPLMKEKPRLLKRLDHIAPMTPPQQVEPPEIRRKRPVKVVNFKPQPVRPESYDYVHYAPYHDQIPFKDHNTPGWHPHDVHDVINRYLIASEHVPNPEGIGASKACACCQDMNRENRKRAPQPLPHQYEPLIKDVGFLQRSRGLGSLPVTTPYDRMNVEDLRARTPELQNTARLVPIGEAWATPEPSPDPILRLSPVPPISLETLTTLQRETDVFPRHPQRAPRNRTPPQPGRRVPPIPLSQSYPLSRPGGLLEPDRQLDPRDYRQMHLTEENRGQVLAAGGYDPRYQEHTPRAAATDEVVSASTRYHRAMEKLNRQINGLRVPNEKTMMEQL